MIIEILRYVAYAALLFFAGCIIYMIYQTILPHRQKLAVMQKAKKYKQKYKTQVTGEVIGNKQEKRMDWLGFCLRRLGRRVRITGPKKEEFEYFVYSPIVKYEVGGFVYEINAQDYTRLRPIVGRKAVVVYNEWNPEDACVWIQRKYRKRLKIWKKDENNIYCSYGLKKDIKIPINEVEEGAVPGRFLLHKYGFYHLEHPEEMDKTFVEMLENPLMEKRDEYK